MSPLEFKKMPCHPVECKAAGPQVGGGGECVDPR